MQCTDAKGAGDYAQRFFSVDYGLAHVIVLDSEHRGDKQLMKQQLKWCAIDTKHTTRVRVEKVKMC